MIEAPLMVVFMTGLLGGVHCAGMCGGIVSALAMRASGTAQVVTFVGAGSVGPISQRKASGVGSTLILYNMGRLGMYTLLGTMAGTIGSVAWLIQTALPLQQIAFAFTNVLLILMGLYLFGVRVIAQWAERIGQKFWVHIQPYAKRQLGSTGVVNTIATGALWGLVPCGMVYGVLMMALVSGSSLKGALLMLVFGLGTLPNLLALGALSQYVAKVGRQRLLRRVLGVVIVAFGILGILRMEAMSQLPFLGDLCTNLR